MAISVTMTSSKFASGTSVYANRVGANGSEQRIASVMAAGAAVFAGMHEFETYIVHGVDSAGRYVQDTLVAGGDGSSADIVNASSVNAGDPVLTAQQTARLSTRSFATLTYPVPTIRPVGDNLPMAFDIQPSGTGLNAANGYSWMDVCDADVIGSFTGDASNTTATSRIAAQTDHVSLESYTNVIGSAKTLWIKTPQSGASRSPLMKLSKCVSGIRTADDQALATDPNVIFSGGSTVASSGFRLPAAATNGFLYLPAIAGAPVGTPAGYGKSVACVYDAATNKLWFYNYVSTTWLSVTAA